MQAVVFLNKKKNGWNQIYKFVHTVSLTNCINLIQKFICTIALTVFCGPNNKSVATTATTDFYIIEHKSIRRLLAGIFLGALIFQPL